MVFYNSRWRHFESEFDVPNAPYPTIHDGELADDEELPPLETDDFDTTELIRRDEALVEEVAHLMPRNTGHADGIRALQEMERDRQADWRLRLRLRELAIHHQAGYSHRHAHHDNALAEGMYESSVSVSDSDSDDMDDPLKHRKRPLSMEGMTTRGDIKADENVAQSSSAAAKLETENKRRRVELPQGDMVHLCNWLENSAKVENPHSVPDLLSSQALISPNLKRGEPASSDVLRENRLGDLQTEDAQQQSTATNQKNKTDENE